MSAASSEEIALPLIEGPLDVSWDTAGDEWEHYLHSRLSERLGDASLYLCGVPVEAPEYYEFTVTEPKLQSRLRLVPRAGGALVFLVTEVDVEEYERELWLDAVLTATKRVGSDHPEFPWFSLLTSEPTVGISQALQEPAEISGMRLRPSGVTYWEYLLDRANLDGCKLRCSSPVIVEGRDRGFDFHSAALKASRRVALLRNLLSVAVDSRWRIKLSPLDRPIPIPERHPTARIREDLPQRRPAPVRLPEWLPDAWLRCTEDRAIADALAMYYEALDIWEGHPSLALLCLVATAEGLGSTFEPLRKCGCCEKCGVRVGSGKAFRAALHLVLSKREAKPLIAAYDRRSKTAHAGILHGSELTAGDLAYSLMQPDPFEDFEMGLVEDLRGAARELMVLALKGEMPGSSPADAPDEN